jgi:hypothetical protein
MRPIRIGLKLFLNAADADRSRLALTGVMYGLALANRIFLETYPRTPRLYASGVVYREERDTECWNDIPTVLSLGWGDCEDLACWRIAEHLIGGVQAMPYITWRTVPSSRTVYHALVRLPDGRIEDPSRALGMRHPIVRRPVYINV